jgi:hypothetical protein
VVNRRTTKQRSTAARFALAAPRCRAASAKQTNPRATFKCRRVLVNFQLLNLPKKYACKTKHAQKKAQGNKPWTKKSATITTIQKRRKRAANPAKNLGSALPVQ